MRVSRSRVRGAVWARVPQSVSAPRRLRANDSTLSVFRSLIEPGDRVFDVGANRGDFAYVASTAAGPTGSVIAFEPNSQYYAQLHRLSQSQSNLDFVASAVSSETGVLELSIPVDADGTRLGWLSTAEASGYTSTVRQYCAAMPLDDAAATIGSPDVVKIDVEGHENAVIDGAAEVFRRCRCALIEIEARHVGAEQAAATLDRLRGQFDHAFYIRNGRRVPVDDFDFQTHQLDLLNSSNMPGDDFRTQPLHADYVSDFVFMTGAPTGTES